MGVTVYYDIVIYSLHSASSPRVISKFDIDQWDHLSESRLTR
jgi:hypothetical protein